MIEIFELKDKQQIISVCNKFKKEALPLDRVFIMQENGDIGLGVLGLESGVVIIKEVYVDKDSINTAIPYFQYFDLLARSLLGIVNNFMPIKVRIKKFDSYYERFGFIPTDDGMEIMSDKIVFNNHCC